MKCAFITGASKGIGKAIANALLNSGQYEVYGISRSASIQHPNFTFIPADLSQKDQLLNFEFPMVEHEKIVLLNNAGTLGEIKYVGSLDNEQIVEAYMLNVAAPHILMNNFIRQFEKTKAEKIIINLSSGAASSIYDGWSVYCTSKGAINRMTEIAAYEQDLSELENPFSIFAIAPGVVETNMQKTIRSADKKDFSRKDKFEKLYKENELSSPERVGEVFLKLIENPGSIENTISRIHQ